ncbi:phenylpyruvate tautomerase MIF-related protein [Treponema primitia]|uniref:phenylpyruvate tautomerase MIF-related protein n=1 Tax=Treponema primitia TaxID=88058 RepID=UPI00025556E4|nr:phenylpyruvate tautomerase MIF-related protein [Treponema primitia]
MPYVAFNISEKLSETQKEKIKSEVGRLITVIPGKTEADTIVDICDGHSMYKGGKAIPIAYVDIRVYTKADPNGKKQFISNLFILLEKELGINKDNVYMSFLEFDQWGDHGAYH